ncbi:hypothetical protein Ccrd_021760 [Cynara cardunculus var. scolymus]|uniref:Uncharacterized protein n=1 Tax=Cynara cardunculus var. scolymus TaxID=59895 RepID=A0A124SEF6_CYNCS|nr:hypothetical protein Ccrd_021760 [Cynara cardunculus var. scolymus]
MQQPFGFILTLSNINSEAVKHSSALAELIREASVKVGDILDDLQMNFFKTLSKDIFVVIQMVEEARTMYYKKLSEFTKKFEVQTEVNDIQSYIGSKTYMLHHKVSDMHGFLSSTEDEYTSFLEKTKKHYIEDKIVTQNGQDGLTAILQNCDALETKQAINTQLSSLASSTVEEIDIAQSRVNFIAKLQNCHKTLETGMALFPWEKTTELSEIVFSNSMVLANRSNKTLTNGMVEQKNAIKIKDETMAELALQIPPFQEKLQELEEMVKDKTRLVVGCAS